MKQHSVRSLVPHLLALLIGTGSALAGSAEIRLDPGVTYQTISGWEAAVNLDNNPFSLQKAQSRDTEILDRLVSEVGINRVRLEIRAGAENTNRLISRLMRGEAVYEDWKKARYAVVNDNADPQVINWAGFDFTELDWQIENAALPLRERLRAQGEDLVVNLTYVAFTKQIVGGRYNHDNPEEYAEFVLATYLHMQEKYGFVPDTWEVILEPDQVPQWNGRVIGRAIVAAARRLKAHGFTPAFIAPSVTNMKNAVPFFDALAAVPGAAAYVQELSYHRYGGRSLKNLRAIAVRADDYGIRTSMLEWWFGKGTYEVLHEDLKVGGVSAWQGRAMAGHFDLKGAIAGQKLKLRDEVRYTRQYFRFIRSGAVRIGAMSSEPRSFDPIAFVNPGGYYTIVIKATGPGTVSIRDLPAGRYYVSYAVPNGSVQSTQPVEVSGDGLLSTTMPDKGVITISALPKR